LFCAARLQPRRDLVTRGLAARHGDDVITKHSIDHVMRLAMRHIATFVDDEELVAQALGLVHVVRRQDNRQALCAHAVDQLPNVETRARIEAGGRFVEE
jgi:hypothetical protein